jgi:hypothetical protein
MNKMKKLLKGFVYGLGALLSFAGYSQSSTMSSEWLLPPRQSYAKIKAIASPVTGMMVYDTTNNCLRIFTGSTWDCLTMIKTPECVAPFNFTQKGGGVGSYNNSDIGADLAMDKNGNVYATGGYQGNAVFGATTLAPLGGYGSDIYLAKFRPDSTVAWAVRAGGSNDDNGISVAVDTSGNAYITGYFNLSATFYGTDAFSINKTATGGGNGYDMFVAKYNTNGILQSVVTIPADYGYGIAVDNAGNAYVTGEFSESFSINGNPYSPNGNMDAYLVKINAGGAVAWFKPFGGTGKDEGSSVFFDVSSNKVFLTGGFSGTVNFGASTLSAAGGQDMFVARFDATTGSNEWVVKGGGTSDDRGSAILLKNNALYTIGWFQGTGTFGTTSVTSNSGSRDVFISSHTTTAGVLNWIAQAGGSGQDMGWNIAADNEGNIFGIGEFTGTALFGSLPLISAGNADMFTTRINSSGGFIQAIKGGGSGDESGRGIVVDNCSVYMLGSFEGTALFGRQLTSAGGSDIFLWKKSK